MRLESSHAKFLEEVSRDLRSRMERVLEAKEREISSAKDTICELTQEVSSARMVVNHLEAEKNSCMEKGERVSRELMRERETSSKFQEEIDLAKSRHMALERETALNRKDLEEKENEVKALRKENEKLKNEYDQILQESNSLLVAKTEAEQMNRSLAGSLERLKQECTVLGSKLREENQKRCKLEMDGRGLENTIGELQSRIEKVQNQASGSMSEGRKYQHDIMVLKDELEKIRTKLDSKERETAELSSSRDTANQQLEAMAKSKAALAAQYNNEINDYKMKLNNLSAQLSSSNKKLEETKETLVDMERRAARAEGTVQALKSSASVVNSASALVVPERKDFGLEGVSNEEANILKMEIGSLKQEIEDKKQKLTRLNDEVRKFMVVQESELQRISSLFEKVKKGQRTIDGMLEVKKADLRRLQEQVDRFYAMKVNVLRNQEEVGGAREHQGAWEEISRMKSELSRAKSELQEASLKAYQLAQSAKESAMSDPNNQGVIHPEVSRIVSEINHKAAEHRKLVDALHRIANVVSTYAGSGGPGEFYYGEELKISIEVIVSDLERLMKELQKGRSELRLKEQEISQLELSKSMLDKEMGILRKKLDYIVKEEEVAKISLPRAETQIQEEDMLFEQTISLNLKKRSPNS